MLKRLFTIALLFTFVVSSSALFAQAKNDKKDTKGNNLETLLNLKDNEILVAKMETSMGTIEIQLFPKEAPKTVKNFVGLSLKKYYNNTTFHRVIDNFMIQGGDPNGDGTGGKSFYGKYFSDEFNKSLRHDAAGILSMANIGQPNTNGSQFFITLAPQPHLNDKHSVFGKVIAGLDVVKAIGKAKTGERNKPLKTVTLKSVTIEKREKSDKPEKTEKK